MQRILKLSSQAAGRVITDGFRILVTERVITPESG
ncbi:MAG: hypothetical protein Ct9H300mP13_2540 [Gammaproteobacteria bacterium]|nr:MAG: hypothetical protein Ct9H300mP13_2540 [Gammaproteobacteria bacterium]